jgi:hypothetical protein
MQWTETAISYLPISIDSKPFLLVHKEVIAMSEQDLVQSLDNGLKLDDYKLLMDAYNGSGGFKNGDYLVSHPRETPEKYQKRKQLAYYLNYVAPVINSHVNPVFRKEPKREWNENDLWSKFIENADTNGTSLHRFMKRAGLMAKLKAVVFIVVDNVTEQPATMAQALKDRAFPYVYTIEPQQVKSYKTNKAGRLISITYAVASETTQSSTAEETWTWTPEAWECQLAGGEIKRGENLINRVPVVPLFSKPMTPGEMLPQSEFYNIVQTNRRIYNLCSEIDELIRNQAFNVLTYPAGEGQQQEDVKEITVGTENVMSYDGKLSNKPEFISPDAAPLQELRAERDSLIKEIYRMASLSHVTGIEQKTSGVAKGWDFEQTNQVLSDFALNCEGVEIDISRLFALWTNTTVNYVCQYSDDFGIVDVSAALDEVGKALDLQIGGRFDVEVKKKAAVVYLNDLTEEDFDAVIEDLEQRSDEVQQNTSFDSLSSGTSK